MEPRGRLTRNVDSVNRGRVVLGGSEANMPKPEDKPFVIPKLMVWEAYRRVAANKGAAGADGQTLEQFEADLQGNLYKIWNRMSSGSYFPLRCERCRSPSRMAMGSGCSACRRSQTGSLRRWWPCI